MPKSEVLTKLQDQDDKILKVLGQHKQVAHSTLRPGEHLKKKLRLYIQSEQTRLGATADTESGSVLHGAFIISFPYSY